MFGGFMGMFLMREMGGKSDVLEEVDEEDSLRDR